MTPKQIYYENAAATIIKGLEKRQMEGYYCPDRTSAVAKALELMPEGSSIAWGGSMSLHESAKTPEEQRQLYGKIACCDYFLMSTNAITMDGELVNIDGRGNRVAFLCYGPQNVIILAGMNKVVTDVDAGLKRVRNTATPPNTVRLHKKTPCAVTGRCGDCFSPDCICSQFVVTRRSGIPGRIKVILVGEELGY